jgi:NAD(P)-dependent dehydrogenase (short-subunit alcohol dehydrogenase family)
MTTTRNALVTGGGRGIGAAIVIALANAGFDVAIASKESKSDAAEVIARARKSGRRIFYCEHDIAVIGQHRPLLERIRNELGDLDCLVNNAGVTSLMRGDMLELTPESFDRTVGINLRGTYFLTQAVAKQMVERSDASGVGYRSIVTITSANAEILGLDRADYCLTKAALSMMSRLYAARLAASRIHVFEVRPGIIATDMTSPATAKYDALIVQGNVLPARWGTPEDVATAVASIAEGRLPFATGEIINVGGGLHLHRV